jgi:hypothetical protein
MAASIDGISLQGFSDPIAVRTLWETRCSAVPADFRIYVVIRASDKMPRFLQKSTGGRFKGKEPTCHADFLHATWVGGAHVVYVGKAAGRQGLKRRLYDLVAFGHGEAIGHWGGRLLWHLPEKEKLLVRWRTCSLEHADKAETNAIGSFKTVYNGRRPYANLRK